MKIKTLEFEQTLGGNHTKTAKIIKVIYHKNSNIIRTVVQYASQTLTEEPWENVS